MAGRIADIVRDYYARFGSSEWDRLKSIGEGPIEFAVTCHWEEIVEADARDLSRWPDASFDAVLSLGPFYHLPVPKDREKAAAEMQRILQPGGRAFVALTPRYTFLRGEVLHSDHDYQYPV